MSNGHSEMERKIEKFLAQNDENLHRDIEDKQRSLARVCAEQRENRTRTESDFQQYVQSVESQIQQIRDKYAQRARETVAGIRGS